MVATYSQKGHSTHLGQGWHKKVDENHCPRKTITGMRQTRGMTAMHMHNRIEAYIIAWVPMLVSAMFLGVTVAFAEVAAVPQVLHDPDVTVVVPWVDPC